MTKREELQKGVAQIIFDLGDPKWQHCLLVADTIMTNLHLKGVVIKVERAVPKNKGYGDVEKMICHLTQQDMLRADFVATMPIREEGK